MMKGMKVMVSVIMTLLLAVVSMSSIVTDAETSSVGILDIDYDNGYVVVIVDSVVDGEQFTVSIDGISNPTVAIGTIVEGQNWIIVNTGVVESSKVFVLKSVSGDFSDIVFTYPDVPTEEYVNVCFNVDGKVTYVSIFRDSTVDRPSDPFKEGSVFEHWSLSQGGQEFDFSTPIDSDITLYAIFSEESGQDEGSGSSIVYIIGLIIAIAAIAVVIYYIRHR